MKIDVLFVCVHNSGRSKMAEYIFNFLAKEYNIKLGEVIISSMKTPSYPSRHSTQGYLIGHYLSEKYDDPKLMKEFMAEAKIISDNRNIGCAHYPSDSKIGIDLGKKMFRYIKKDIENKL